MDANQNLLENDLVIDNTSHTQLKEAAMWAKFLGITGFVFSVLMVIAAIFAGSVYNSYSNQYYGSRTTNMISGSTIMFIYLAGALLAFFFSLFLYRFATKMQSALMNNDQETLNNSFGQLKIYFRFAGILTIIYLVFVVLALVGVIVAAGLSH